MKSPNLDLRELFDGKEVPKDVTAELGNFLMMNPANMGRKAYLNNLFLRLPGIRIEMLGSVGGQERILRELDSKPENVNGCSHSELRASQTLREFWEVIDGVIERLHLTGIYEELNIKRVELNFNRRVHALRDDEEAKRALRIRNHEIRTMIEDVVAFPTYWHLRAMGYSRYPDLIV